MAAGQPELDGCKQQVKDCEHALKSADDVIKTQSELVDNLKIKVKLQDEQLVTTYKLLQKERDSSSAWYKQPELTIPAALILGLIGGFYIGHH
jgi:hypothetical protein